MDSVVEPVLAPLDHARVVAIRLLGPVGRTLVVRRELRIGVAGVAGVLVALCLTMGLPTWVIAFSPLFLGVPHLVADARYLVIRPGLHRRLALWALIGVPLALLVLTDDSRLGLLALPGAAVGARGTPIRKLVGGLLGLGLVGLAVAAGRFDTGMALAHGHNLVAMGIFLLWRRRTSWWHWAPVAAFALGYAGFLLGVWPVGSMLGDPLGQNMVFHLSWYAPGVAAPWGERLVLSFAFAQSVHYGLWLRLVPDEDQVRSTTRTLRRTVRDVVADLGWPITLGVTGLGVGIAAWGLVDPLAARTGYLDLALFHGYLELAVLMLWLVERRQRGWPARSGA
jgi:hypothetical protein